ncbi:MAG: glutamate 5-kinase [Elusimicrobia bacterium CG_4_10_14_3_um_filter_49_12_50_7]|nr:MAG: glutamate 5-kinase [Elusimicrobia bacterium CG03_land_8_20_14_0_80_50_18]PIX16168.1 MAG: glutamate 5-kinase [Elusimicrobia bacterium CG_4_8_14_3_um_filter_50_9]PIY16752.1 MAG: glutamate 5-kinase [Elusimicrobia bacterium CG_4_10_14_3_um_filter_49_12_50_7]
MLKRAVVKLGTGLLSVDGGISASVISAVAGEIAFLQKNGFRILVVSSGAVGCGMIKLGRKRPKDISGAQMLASVGQPLLMDMWMKALSKKGLNAAQVLCSADDFSDRKKYLNLRRALLKILDEGIVPVINENDSVTVDELKFGDNDRLSALAASHIDARDLVILTNVDGLYVNGKLVDELKNIDEAVLQSAGGASEFGTGGMRSKLLAAKITGLSGCRLTIASGKKRGVLRKILFDGKNPGTLILPSAKIRNRKRWIAFASACCSSISVDAGAYKAIVKNGRSLLAAGITGTDGVFAEGDTVNIAHGTKIFARGIVNYSDSEVRKIQGCQSSGISKVLGRASCAEVINRDNLVLTEE